MVDKSRLVVARGFTLIELLVVVAILSVIMTLLIPALGRARQQALAVQCQSNLRQVYSGFVMYAQAFNDRIPPIGNAQTDGRGWFRYLGRQGYWGQPEVHGVHAIERWNVFRCGAEAGSNLTEATFGGFSTYYDSRYMGTSYVMNYYVSFGLWDIGWPANNTKVFRYGLMAGPERVSATYPPSYLARGHAEAPLVMDIQDMGEGWGLYFFLDPDYPTTWDYVGGYTGYYYSFRHPNKTANVLFMDGHVEARKHPIHGGTPFQKVLWSYPPNQVP